MHPALWISKTGLDAKQRDISVISNNLANASTVGFKKSRAILKICCTKTSISLVVHRHKILNCPMA